MSKAYLNPVTDQQHSVLAALRGMADVDIKTIESDLCEWCEEIGAAPTATVYWTPGDTTETGLMKACESCVVEVAERAASRCRPGTRVTVEVAAVPAELSLAVAA